MYRSQCWNCGEYRLDLPLVDSGGHEECNKCQAHEATIKAVRESLKAGVTLDEVITAITNDPRAEFFIDGIE
jgi:hypothetical protein